MNDNNNDLLVLGLSILAIGLLLSVYSISTHFEIIHLKEKIVFEDITDNIKKSYTEKYYEHLEIADFLNKKINKNKNIPIKNTSCIYLDYAQQNAILLYELTKNKNASDTNKSVAAGNVRKLYNALDNYKSCKRFLSYKTELNNILQEIQNQEQHPSYYRQSVEEFLHTTKTPEQKKETTEETVQIDQNQDQNNPTPEMTFSEE